MGLAPTIVAQIFERIGRIRQEATLTIILVEQRVVEALEARDEGYVLSTGRVVASGSGHELLRDKLVNEAYLGG